MAECNGGESLCNRSYSDITHLITHDSYALSPNIAATQDTTIVDQLNDGVRGIKLTAAPSTKDNSIIHLCHTYCHILDAGLATDTLNKINSWLDENPKEVVTIMWNNLYNFKATQIAAVYQASDIMPKVYYHEQSDDWPTLQRMIETGKRLVNFIDAEADNEQVPWLMDQFSHVFETPYDNTDINAFNCNVDRIGQEMNPKELMYVMNHFLYGIIELGSLKIEIPIKEQAHNSNNEKSLSDHVNMCKSAFDKKPNFIEVDFYTIGDALSVVSSLNDVMPPSISSKKLSAASVNGTSSPPHHISMLPTNHVLIDNGTNRSLNYRGTMTLLVLHRDLVFYEKWHHEVGVQPEDLLVAQAKKS
ncbi:PLC-like phosphodiesterase [Mucor mucedo]|uniref:PLC-like phosphodiesterase n=1 Tax=Mucor mucedo TaxID=29922 RepID=UPI00221E7D76|nr:PLC-like phosphodiesterase [Mucor mucedo]KAI7894136.1 PLC-like phosphodiesterase [Mucor mucedo]